MNAIETNRNKPEFISNLSLDNLNQKEKKEIGKVIHYCTSFTSEITSIFYLYSEIDFTHIRHTFPFNPEMEFLIITDSKESAKKLFSKLVKERASSLADALSYTTLTNYIVISTDEFTEGLQHMEFFAERLYRSLVVYEG